MSSEISTPPSPPLSGPNSGKWTVVGMFAFGVFMVLVMWFYWELHTRPFRPLQLAIAAAYPDSSPIVVGGKHKSHKPESKKTLRIAVRVPPEEFDPTQDRDRREQRALELYRLARQHQKLEDYEVLEIHLMQRNPEREDKVWTKSVPVAKLREVFPDEM